MPDGEPAQREGERHGGGGEKVLHGRTIPRLPCRRIFVAIQAALLMAQLFVEPAKVARARELARSAALGVQAFIDRHTTVSIERTVLRLLGISGAGTRGAPLANLMVDRLREAGVLAKGAAYWPGGAPKASPSQDSPHAIGRLAA